MKLRDLIDEGVLADARKVDSFIRKHDPGKPSIETTLRLVRDVDTGVLRRIGNDIWGVGGENDLVRKSFDNCVVDPWTTRTTTLTTMAASWIADDVW